MRLKWGIIALFMTISISVFSIDVQAANLVQIHYEGGSHSIEQKDLTILVSGEPVVYDGMFPVIVDGRTLVPVREVLENPAIGASVDWIGAENKIVVTKESMTVELVLGSETAYINGVASSLDRSPVLMRLEGVDNAKTMVPLRFITEALGFTVGWNGETSTIELDKAPVIEAPVIGGPEDEEVVEEEDNPIADENQTGDSHQDADQPTLEGDVLAKVDGFVFEAYEDEFDYEDTVINTVKYNKYQDLYSIRTKSEMSSINYFIWEGKFIIDIDNASIGNIDLEVDVELNDYVTSVRSSQFSYEPLQSRIVFELLEGIQPTSIVISEDRDRIDVLFGNDGIKDIALGQLENGDYLDISGEFSDINVFRLEDPHRIVVDLENTINPFGAYSNDDYNGTRVTAFRIGQFNETTTRVVFETNARSGYEIQTPEEGMTRIYIGSVQQVEEVITPIDTYPELLRISDGNISSDTQYSIDYSHHEKTAIITLDSIVSQSSIDNATILAEGKVKAITKDVNKVMVKTDHIYDVQVEVLDGALLVRGVRPSELYQNIVVIDPGHGGYKPGAIMDSTYEKDLNLTLSEYIRNNMDGTENVHYYFTRHSDLHVSLEERVEIANDIKADLFISIHCNSLDIKRYPYQASINGLEVHVTDTTEQSDLEYSVAEDVLDYLRDSDIAMEAKSIKIFNELYVLKNTYMPSILIELGYMTNRDDFLFLSNPEKLVEFESIIKKASEGFFDN